MPIQMRWLAGLGLVVGGLCATLVVAAEAPAVIAAGPQPARASRPNILFLFADDMRADTIAAHGNPHIRTPHLDALVRRGFSFRRAYVMGGDSGAVCVASRAMLMSGRTMFHVDTRTLSDATLLPELLGRHGYTTFGTGKWHNGEASWLRAFQRGRTVMFGGMSDHTKVPVRDLAADGTLTPQRIATTFSSELFADSVIDFLRTAPAANAPFFAYVAFTAPHDPRQPPLAYREPYYRSLPPLPPNFLPQLPFDNGMMRGGRDENLGAWPRTEAMVRDQLAEYYGLVTHMDEQIGRILATLEETGQAQNTIVVFAADNGLAIGSHGLLGKQSVFEHSTHVPLVVAGPGVPTGASQTFSYLHDLFPTLAELAQVETPEGLDGQTLQPVWQGTAGPARDSMFLAFMQVQRAVRDDRWKLIAYPAIGYLQLFDLAADPHETTNVAADPAHAGELRRLQAAMREWQQRAGDTLDVPTTSRDPEPVDLTGQAREPDQWQPAWIVEKYFRPARP